MVTLIRFFVAAAPLLMLSACSEDDAPAQRAAPTETVAVLPECYAPQTLTAPTVDGHGCTWAHGALVLQEALERHTPFGEASFIATHNSYNASAYPQTVANRDPNQSLTLGDQLALDMRGLELDVHWFPHAPSGGNAALLCHGLPAAQLHGGCTPLDLTFADGLREIAAWAASPASRDAVLLLDIENHLAEAGLGSASPSEAAHLAAIAEIEDILGPLIFRPAQDGQCHSLPLDLSRAQVLAAGKKILLTSDCGTGAAWPGWVFDIGSVRRQKANDGFNAFPDCEADFFSAEDYSTRFTRVWHDSTRLSGVTSSGLQPIDAPTLTEMLKCGINMPSLDLLVANDARFAAAVWSWAPSQPKKSASPQCARLETDAHFHSAACGESAAYACRKADGSWAIATPPGAWAEGDAVCTAAFGAGARFEVPRSPASQARLTQQLIQSGQTRAWVRYDDAGGSGAWRSPSE